MVVAAPFWLWPWLAGLRRLNIDRIGEASSTARRAFLFAVSGLAIGSAALAGAFIVYRVTRVATGLDSSSLGSDVRMPLCVVIVALPLLALHAYWLRRDLDDTRDGGRPAAVSGAVVAGGVETGSGADLAPAAQAAALSQELVIGMVAEADLEPLRAWLVATLPPGCTVVVRSRQGAAPD
jgi:hypothetical protein